MNRKQRRDAKKLAGRKPNRSAIIYETLATRELKAFDTIDRLFEQLKTGHLRYEQSNGWVTSGLNNTDLHVTSALEGWIKYWQELTEGMNIPHYDDSALVKLNNSLEYSKPMKLSEVSAAYEVVQKQRELFRLIPKEVLYFYVNKTKANIIMTDEIIELEQLAKRKAA